MKIYTGYKNENRNDLFQFMKSLMKHSFCIADMPSENIYSDYILSNSSSPYIKKLNSYSNMRKSEPITIYI